MKNRTRLLAMAMAVAIGATGFPTLNVSAGNVSVAERQTGDDGKIALQTLQQGWQLEDENWYYYEAGQKVTGWKQIGSTYYYLYENGRMAADTWIGEYYVNASGAWVVGKRPAKWMQDSNGWWYRNEDGSYPVNRWQYIDGEWYYFNQSGYMVTGWLYQGGSWYYLDESGKMVKWFRTIDGKSYYFSESGVMQTGWQRLEGNWYYYQPGGAMSYGWLYLNGIWYFMDDYGVMQTGVQEVNGEICFFAESGAMFSGTGWKQIDGFWYYFKSGVAARNCWISGIHYVKADGTMATDEWVDGGKYYVDENGVWVSQPVHKHQYVLTGSDAEYRYYQCVECQETYQEYNDVEYEVDLGNGEKTKITGHYDLEMAREIFEKLNKYREENGVPELAEGSEKLQEAANIRGYEIAHTFDHVRPNGVRALTSFSSSTHCCAENIAAYQRTAESVMTDWKESAGHNANMLSKYATSVSISVFAEPYLNRNGDVRYRYYFVQLFAW